MSKSEEASKVDSPGARAPRINIEIQWQIENREHCPEDDEIRRWVQMAIESDGVLSEPAGEPVAIPATINEVWLDSESELTVRVVDSDEIRRANHQWRGIDKATNVLSFPSDFPPEIGLLYYGDLLICAEILSAESIEQDKSTLAHWAHIVIHGTLHLLGYDHVDPAAASVMERREIEILATLGIHNPYLGVGDSEITPIGGH